MTDITPIPSAGGPGGVDPAGDPKKHAPGPVSGGPSFAEVLARAAGPTAGAGGPSAASDAQAPPAAYIGPVGTSPAVRKSILNSGERLLDLIEAYRTRLGDPRATLKDIDPLVRRLEAHRDKMLGQIAALGEKEPGRGLLEEMAVLASSEAAKFRRGDYI